MRIWQKLSLVLEVMRRFRQCGREAQTVNSFSRERAAQAQFQGGNKNQNGMGSKSELDSLSKSSQDSGLSRVSASNNQDGKPKPQVRAEDDSEQRENMSTLEATETFKQPLEVAAAETPPTGTKSVTRYSEIRGRFSNLLGTL